MSNEASVQAAALEAAVIDNTGAAVVQAAALEAAIITNLGFSGVQAAALEAAVLTAPENPTAVLSNITGTVDTLATFNGSASVGSSFEWLWTSVPGGSAISNGAINYPDNGASSPINMTDNEVLFHFDGNADDTSGNSNSLSLVGTSYGAGRSGVAATALGFPGGSARGTLGTPVDLSGGSWTVAFWFYNLAPTGAWRTGVRGSSVDNQIIVEHNSNRLGVYASGNGNFRYSGFDMPSADYQGWHHIVAVGSGTTTTFYVDGVLRGSSDRKSVANIRTIGNYPSGGQRFADRIDEFAIWSRALSEAEVSSIYALQRYVPLSETSSLSFTPDVAGTYTVQFTSRRGGYADVSVTRNAVISSATPPSTGIGDMTGAALSQRSLSGTHFMIPLTGIDPSEGLD